MIANYPSRHASKGLDWKYFVIFRSVSNTSAIKSIFFILTIALCTGCGLRQREIELERKAKELTEREQQLNLKEQSLIAKEDQLNDRQKKIDSTNAIIEDSLTIAHNKVPGVWNVDMTCTNTNCPGSAVGDIKNEQWQFRFEGNVVIVSAMANNKLVRSYTGAYSGNVLKLTVVQEDTDEPTFKMNIRLNRTKENEMEGEREIIQASGCRILYSLKLKKI